MEFDEESTNLILRVHEFPKLLDQEGYETAAYSGFSALLYSTIKLWAKREMRSKD